uniref:Uncharacterized protein n=1 Tax=Arundo donax TaxID=35708 RepID=A0A0A8Z382_ARUDO
MQKLNLYIIPQARIHNLSLQLTLDSQIKQAQHRDLYLMKICKHTGEESILVKRRP